MPLKTIGRPADAEGLEYILDPSLVLYLPLGKRDGSSFISDDAYGHLATVAGALWRLNGREFDSIDDKIDLGSPSALKNLTAKTVLMWFKVPGFTGASRVLYDGSYLTSPYGDNFIPLAGSNAVRVYLETTVASAYTDVAFTPDTWTQMGYSWNGTKVTNYKNGQVYPPEWSDLTGTLACSNTNLLLGKDNAGNYPCNGMIGEFLVRNRASTAAEMQNNYLASKWRYQ